MINICKWTIYFSNLTKKTIYSDSDNSVCIHEGLAVVNTIEDKDAVGYEFLNTLESLPELATDLKKNCLPLLDPVKLAMFPECEKEVDPDIITKLHAFLGTDIDIFDWEDGTPTKMTNIISHKIFTEWPSPNTYKAIQNISRGAASSESWIS